MWGVLWFNWCVLRVARCFNGCVSFGVRSISMAVCHVRRDLLARSVSSGMHHVGRAPFDECLSGGARSV